MEKNRLSKKLQEALNTQITKEASASQFYLSHEEWASNKGYGGIAHFLFRHATEDRNRMMKILEFILERGAKVKIEAISASSEDTTNIQNCFEQIFEH
jgi:ferritin